MVRKRGGWLSVLFLGEMLTATAMGYFEDEIAKAVVLAHVRPADHQQRRQLRVAGGHADRPLAGAARAAAAATGGGSSAGSCGRGLTLGRWLGLIGFLRIIAWQLRWAGTTTASTTCWSALTVWLSLIGVVTFGSLAGSMLPFVLRRLGFDPATSSAPFVATLVDVTGLVIYFTVAALILTGTVL